MANLLKFTVLLLVVSALAFGQATTAQTTLAAAVLPNTTTQWCVASATGINTPSLSSGYTGTILFVDQEAAQVQAAGSSATCFKVKRGQFGTSAAGGHGTTSKVWVGDPVVSTGDTSRPLPGAFVTFPPSGTCTATAQATLPVIVTGGAAGISRGQIWDCYGSVWTRADLDLQRVYTDRDAAMGTIRAIRGEAIASNAAITSGNLVGARGAVTLGTATTAGSGAYLYGVQGKAITSTGTVNVGSGEFTGVFGQIDVTGGTLTSGHISAISGNIYGLTGGTASTVNILYLEHAGGGVANSFIQAFGKTTYVFDLSSNTHVQMGTTGAATTAAGWLKLLVEGQVRYINLWSTAP